MASSSTNGQVLESQRYRRKHQRPHKSPARSNNRRQTRKRSQVNEVVDDFYTVKNIIDESDDKYLIDWDDDPLTGKSYTPTWEPKENANHAAIESWKQIKRRQGGGQIHSQPRQPTIPATPRDSDPPKPAKRRRVANIRTSTQSNSSISEPLAKKSRLGASIGETVRTAWSEGGGLEKDEIEDSYEGEAESNSLPANEIQVAISFHSSIDSGAYITVQDSQQPFSIKSQIRLRVSPDIQEIYSQNSEVIIPDSQEIPTSIVNSQESQINNTTRFTSSSKNSENCSRGDKIQDEFPVIRPFSKRIKRPPGRSDENPHFSQDQREHTSQPNGGDSLACTTQSYISWTSVKPFSNRHSSIDSKQYRATTGSSKESQNSNLQLQTAETQDSITARQRAFCKEFNLGASIGSEREDFVKQSDIRRPNKESNFQTQVIRENSIVSATVFSESNSGPSGFWQATQVLSPNDPPLSVNRLSAEPKFEIFQDDTASSADQVEPSQNSAVLSQQDGNSAGSFSQSQELKDKSQNDLTSHHKNQQTNLQITENLSSQEFESFPPSHLIPSSGLPEFPDSYTSHSPCRPEPLSCSIMSSSQDAMELESNASLSAKSMSVREQMRLRRAESAASRPIAIVRSSPGSFSGSTPSPLQSGIASLSTPMFPSVPIVPSTRSPSLTPARISSPQIPPPPSPLNHINHVNQTSVQSNQMLPNRGVTSLAPSLPLSPRIAFNTPLKQEKDHSSSQSIKLPKLGPMEYIVPLPMMSRVRSIYELVIRKNKRDIQEFTNNENNDPQLAHNMEDMINTLKRLGDHQDTDEEMSASQANWSDEMIKKWAENCSTKCAFIRALFDALRLIDVHIVVLARPGRMIDILQAMFRYQGYRYDCPHRGISSSLPNNAGPLRITLLPTGNPPIQYPVISSDMVIAFDETFKINSRGSQAVRNDNKLCPLIYLVVVNSAEHLELLTPKPAMRSRERTRALISAIVETRHEVGKLDAEDVPPDEAANLVAMYLHSYFTSLNSRSVVMNWPMPPIKNIPGVDFTGVQFRPDSSAMLSTPSTSQIQIPQVSRSSAKKRSYDGSDPVDQDSSKRARSTPVPGEMNSSIDVSRAGDSIGSQSQINQADTNMDEDGNVKSEYHDLMAQNTALLAQVAALSSKVTDLEAELLTRQRNISDLYKAVAERNKSFENIAPKYQEAIKDSADARLELKQVSKRNESLAEQNESLAKRSEQRDTENRKLKEEKSTLQTELESVRKSLLESTVPEQAELAKKDEELRALKEALEKQEKKAASAEKLADFTRGIYQQGQAVVTELSAEISGKEQLIIELTRKADDNRVLCAEAQAQSEKGQFDQRISELEAQLQDRDDELSRRREELKSRGLRRETRGVSVPRSPAGSRVVAPHSSSRSRGGSPAVGDLGSSGGGGGRDRDGEGLLAGSTKRIRQLQSD